MSRRKYIDNLARDKRQKVSLFCSMYFRHFTKYQEKMLSFLPPELIT